MKKTRHHLAEVIGKKTLETTDYKKLAKQVAAYLLGTGQTYELQSLMRDILAYRAAHGVIEITATSANELSQADINDIKAMLKQEYPKAKSFEIDEAIDGRVMGGVKLDLPNEQLDLTVRAKVNTFKRLTTFGDGA